MLYLMNFITVHHCSTVTASLHRCYVQCYPRDVQDATERCCVVCVPVRRYTVDIYTVSTQRRYLHRVDIYTAPRGYLRPRTGSCGGNDGPRARAVTPLRRHNNLTSHTFLFGSLLAKILGSVDKCPNLRWRQLVEMMDRTIPRNNLPSYF